MNPEREDARPTQQAEHPGANTSREQPTTGGLPPTLPGPGPCGVEWPEAGFLCIHRDGHTGLHGERSGIEWGDCRDLTRWLEDVLDGGEAK